MCRQQLSHLSCDSALLLAFEPRGPSADSASRDNVVRERRESTSAHVYVNRCILLFAIAAVHTNVSAQAATGPDSLLVKALLQNRAGVSAGACGLEGEGGRMISAAAANAQFTIIGEAHGVAQVPEFSGALYCRLVESGYRHLAIEVSPPVASGLEKAGRRGLDGIKEFGDKYFPGAPFYMLSEEAQLLVRVLGDTPGAAGVLWGLDYDVSAEGFIGHRLLELATAPARPAAANFLASVEASYTMALARGNPAAVFSFAGESNRVSDLRKAMRPEKGSEADGLLEVLETTLSINGEWLAGRGYSSNVLRSANLRKTFLNHFRRASGGERVPKVLVKLGAAHAYRGRNPSNTFDVGSLLPELAALSGSSAVGILVVGGRGSRQSLFDPATFDYAPVGNVYDGSAWIQPFYTAAGSTRWTSFDLRALRPLAGNRRLGTLPAATIQAIFGFDFLVVLDGSTPATPLSLVRPPWAVKH